MRPKFLGEWGRFPASAVNQALQQTAGPHVGFSRVIVARRPRLLSWVVRRQWKP